MDGRLLLPAAGAWGSAALCLLIADARIGWWLCGLGALLGTVGLVRRVPILLRVTALGIAIGLIAGAGTAAARMSRPWQDWVQAGRTATIEAVVTGDTRVSVPRRHAIWQQSVMVRVPVRIEQAQVDARAVALRVPADLSLRTGPAPRVGQRIRLRARLSAQGHAILLHQRGSIAVIGEPGALNSWANATRSRFREVLSGFTGDAPALIAGLSVGDASLETQALSDRMRTAGLSHLTAVSGGNLAILTTAVLLIAAGLRRRTRVMLALGVMAMFIVLVRPQPSVVRAAVMGGLVLLGIVIGGRRAGPAVLCASVMVLVAITPDLVLTWGFALSVAATAGLILLEPHVADRCRSWRLTGRFPPALREGISIALAAQLATLPVLVAMGAGVGVYAVPANLLAMPAVAPVTILGLLAGLLSPVAAPVAAVFALLAIPFAWWIASIATVVAGWPGASATMPGGVAGLVLAAGGIGAIVLVARLLPPNWRRHSRLPLLALLITALALWLLLPPGNRGWPPRDWVMVMCDVGQGDALVVRGERGEVLVVDAGPDPALIDGCLSDLGISSIDLLVLTHFHADHVDGVTGVLRGRTVRAAWVTGLADPPAQQRITMRVLASAGIPTSVGVPGEAVPITGMDASVLWPSMSVEGASPANNASIVLLMRSRGLVMLLTGDVEPPSQERIIAGNPRLHVDVMKVPHHGSRFQDPRLRTWSGARIALISVGEGNDYGHPATQTLQAWRGALLGRTDMDGDIAVVGRGASLGIVRH